MNIEGSAQKIYHTPDRLSSPRIVLTWCIRGQAVISTSSQQNTLCRMAAGRHNH
ncbi:MAG: hypothetical protein PUA82_07860 [Eubacteriales bacterium]|nr:hypothetical protein [Eubacteriales bacterium]